MEQSLSIQNGINTADFTDLNLGNIYKNLPIKLSIQIKNLSAISEALDISFNGANINFVNNCPAMLGTRSSCNVELSVNGSSLSEGTNLVGFLVINNDSYNLTGSIIAPLLTRMIQVTSIDYGNIEATRSKTMKMIVSNKVDDIDLNMDASNLGSSFSIVKNSCPLSLKSRSSCSLDIKAESASPSGAISGSIQFGDTNANLSANIVAYNPLLPIIPSINTLSINTSSGSGIEKFSISYFNQSLTNLNPVSFALPQGVIVESSTCGSIFYSRKSCLVNFALDLSQVSSSFNADIKMLETDRKESQPVNISLGYSNPTLSVSLPPYSTLLTADATITTNYADQIKVSNNADCSDGAWVPLANPLNISLSSTQNNIKYFKAKKINSESPCVSASTIQDSIDPLISYTINPTGELNRTGLSTDVEFSFSITDLNSPPEFSYKIFSESSCAGSELSSNSGSLRSGSGSVNITLPVRQLRSIKVSHSDLSGRSFEICSNTVTFGIPASISIPQFASSVKMYENATTFTGTVKDQFNNNLEALSIDISSPIQSISALTNASGIFTFKVSSLESYAAADGVKIYYVNNSSGKVTAVVNGYPSIASTAATMLVRRRSCQEYASIDVVSSSGNYVIDPDLESSTISEYSIDCDITTGIDLISVANSSITNRAKISTSLKSMLGVERIMFNSLVTQASETGPSSAVVK